MSGLRVIVSAALATLVAAAGVSAAQDVRFRRPTSGAVAPVFSGVIEGRILDSNGKPAKGVSVFAFQPGYYEGLPVIHASLLTLRPTGGSGMTDKSGVYRIDSLRPGVYYIAARLARPHSRFLAETCLPPPRPNDSALGFPSNLPGLQARMVRRVLSFGIPDALYYPGVARADAAQNVQVRDDSAARADFQLAEAPKPLRLRGEVVDAAGNRIKRAKVTLVSSGSVLHDTSHGMARFCNVEAGNGTFEMTNIFAGAYTVIATGEVNDAALAGAAAVEIADDVKEFRVVVHPRPAINGMISLEQTSGPVDVSRLTVQLIPALPPQLPVADPFNRTQGAVSEAGDTAFLAAVNKNGAFSLRGLLPGLYRLQISGLPNPYLRSARSGQSDVLAEGLSLSSTPTGPLEIVVADGGATLDISLKDAKNEPATNKIVTLVPDAADPARRNLYLHRAGSTDHLGQLRLEGIAPGRYRLYSWDAIPDGAWQSPDFLRYFADRATAIEVTAGSTPAIELRH